MDASEAKPGRCVQWGVAGRAFPGEAVSGDLHFVKVHAQGAVAGVVDGIGHGVEAVAAARAAVEVLQRWSTEPVISLIKRSHEALVKTRGAVMALATFDAVENTITWAGVGNVEIRLARANPSANPAYESALLRNGLVGYQLPALHASVLPIFPGDTVIFATDGIRAGFASRVRVCDPPERIAEWILDSHFKGSDDALVMAVRYLGIRHG